MSYTPEMPFDIERKARRLAEAEGLDDAAIAAGLEKLNDPKMWEQVSLDYDSMCRLQQFNKLPEVQKWMINSVVGHEVKMGKLPAVLPAADLRRAELAGKRWLTEKLYKDVCKGNPDLPTLDTLLVRYGSPAVMA